MPYFHETFANEWFASASKVAGASSFRRSVSIDESARIMSYRTRSHPRAITSREVINAAEVDPYAYFLDSTSRKAYQARLAERGMVSQGDPDRGHSFELIKHRLIASRPKTVTFGSSHPSSGWTETHQSPYIVPEGSASMLSHVHDGGFFKSPTNWPTDLATFAQQAYNKSAPTAVVFDAAAFLGELREGLPSAILFSLKSRGSAARAVGSKYLNVQFGWLPLISDIKNAISALTQATNMLAQQGQRVHRTFGIPVSSTFDQLEMADQSVWIQSGFNGLLTDEERTLRFPNDVDVSAVGTSYYDKTIGNFFKTFTVRKWFEGEFSSFFPLQFDPNEYLSRASVLINTKLTPATLWQLSPWSWLIDWFFHLDRTIEANITAANDLLVMHYGFAMEHSRASTNASWSHFPDPWVYRIGVGFPERGSATSITERKLRIRANPFGFNPGGQSDLSLGQLAILGALGLTRL